ncbi:hypothetical protein SADUNF_Sadunf19G0084400 [Salix dunnii]|uniref:Uncharacterized protein n=1 Tax=Salix dunnii TaxID=1413687 RepID=A0A835J149_9ROSI|nr:hypothetical protein SADUNF_Sadunf19G0084400 [Salix dunnii]
MAIGSLLSRLVTKMATTTNKECSVKFKSPGLVEKDKEKMGEGCDYARPNIGQGISHGSADETTCPTELLCDGHGKCRHGTAKVLNVARGKVSEVAHVEDLFKNHKEMVMVHEPKDKKANETASEKVHEAKESHEDAYKNEKRESKRKLEMSKKVKQKTWARRLGLILYITSQRKQKEIAEKAKESTKHATNMISAFVNR